MRLEPAASRHYDFLLVGGGLQAGLIALAARELRPDATVAIVERGDRLGGNHTWCFHEDDVPARIAPALEPAVARRWPGYEVRFPGHRRRVDIAYAAVTSDSLHDAVARRVEGAPGCDLVLGADAREVSESGVALASGERLSGRLVVDARGPRPDGAPEAGAGYQSFVGLELQLRGPHGLAEPVVMDARVPQLGGFRFFYALPFSPRRILLEDTYFADEPELDRELVAERVRARAGELGLEIERVAREEAGVLPMPWSGGLPRAPAAGAAVAAGYRGGFFHPATGYSFPAAARVAECLASRGPEEGRGALAGAIARHRRQARLGQLLNLLSFRFMAPAERYRAYERFYRLPEPTIRRFYALEMTIGDGLRILGGKPPAGLSVRRALAGAGAGRAA